jgi:hypothetical protein
MDGVISLFGFREGYGLAPEMLRRRCPRPLHSINGIPHYISAACGGICAARGPFELVWPPAGKRRRTTIPHLLDSRASALSTFDGRATFGSAHWKIDAIDEHAGDRPAAWIDDNWTRLSCLGEQRGPTLIIETVRHRV